MFTNSLKTQLYLFYCLIIVFFVIIKAVELHYIQLPQLYSLESLADEKDISRIRMAFSSKSKEFGVINYDNAVWNDSYHYINNRNDEFPEENFVIDAYKSLGLNGIHLFDKKAELVWSRSWNRNTWRKIIVPAFELPSAFVKEQMLISMEQVVKNNNQPLTKAGYTLLEGKLILFAATSIFQANLQGSANGTMLFWRFFDEKVLIELQERAGIKFQIEFVNFEGENSTLLSSQNVYKKGSYRTDNNEIYDFFPFVAGNGGIKFIYQAPIRQFSTHWLNRSSLITLLLFLSTLFVLSLFFSLCHYQTDIKG